MSAAPKAELFGQLIRITTLGLVPVAVAVAFAVVFSERNVLRFVRPTLLLSGDTASSRSTTTTSSFGWYYNTGSGGDVCEGEERREWERGEGGG